MNKKIFGWIFKAPMYLMLTASLVASYYAAINNISGISYASPIIMTVLSVLFIIGEVMHRKEISIIREDSSHPSSFENIESSSQEDIVKNDIAPDSNKGYQIVQKGR
jgi:hypothetical protein